MARSTAARCAGDHHLAGRVEVHRLDHLALRGLVTACRDLRVREPEDGRHGAGAGRNRFLHHLAPEPHQIRRRVQRQRLRAHQRGELAQGCGR